MIKIENTEVVGWEAAIRGMRNPMNSWEKSDSCFGKDPCRCDYCDHLTWECYPKKFNIGPNDYDLMMRLAKGGSVHAKYRRMIAVYADITAPLYWWKEFDTYKVGTVANSCSTMHKIHEKEFTLEDFSFENIPEKFDWFLNEGNFLDDLLFALNDARENYIKTKDKKYWWQMIQLLPSSYNQKRTVMLNYEVLANIYKSRRSHKLDEWVELCKWIETLPYSELITGQSLGDLPICNEIMEEAKKRATKEG